MKITNFAAPGFAISALVTILFNGPLHAQPPCSPAGKITNQQFRAVMQTVADGWNRGDAQFAASCFAETAVYSAPPALPRRGRKALYDFFGGSKGRDLPMHMTWHNLIFDPAQQVGVGEYTFRYKIQTHGLVIVRIEHGLITKWREYEVESNLPWDQFTAENKF